MGKIYNKRAIMIGAFIGGPLVAGYLIAENFKVFDEKENEKKAWIYSIIITVLIFGSLFTIPNIDKIPKQIIPLIYTYFAVFIYQKYQETKIKVHLNDGGQTYNLWRTIGIGFIGLIIIILPIFGYAYLSERNSEVFNTTRTYGITKNSIIYDKKDFTEKEIDILAKGLQSVLFFNNDVQRYIYVKKVGNNYELSITVNGGTEKNSTVIEPFMQLRNDIQSLFPKNKIVINLVVESLDNVVKRLE